MRHLLGKCILLFRYKRNSSWHDKAYPLSSLHRTSLELLWISTFICYWDSIKNLLVIPVKHILIWRDGTKNYRLKPLCQLVQDNLVDRPHQAMGLYFGTSSLFFQLWTWRGVENKKRRIGTDLIVFPTPFSLESKERR